MLRDGIIPVERTVHDAGPDFQHQMSTPRRPAHLLLGIHSPMQQPLHRALGDRRRNRFFLPARCRVVDDDVGLSGHISLQIAQEPRHLARGGGRRRHIVGCNVYCNHGFSNEIQSAFNLTMPETPSSTSLAVSFRAVGPARGRLSDMLNPHREMKPVQYIMRRTEAGGFAERSWTISTIAQDGDRCCGRRAALVRFQTEGEISPNPKLLCDDRLATDRIRAAGRQHPVQHRHADRSLVLLSRKAAGSQPWSDQRLVTTHCRFY